MFAMFIRWLIFFWLFTKFVSACVFPMYVITRHHIIIIIIQLLWEVFTKALADGLPPKFE